MAQLTFKLKLKFYIQNQRLNQQNDQKRMDQSPFQFDDQFSFTMFIHSMALSNLFRNLRLSGGK